MIKLLIVEDQQSMREALCAAFSQNPETTVAGGLSDARLALACCRREHPDLVLMDVCTENNASGLDAAREIADACPDIRIIIMTGFDEVSYIPRAKASGAQGFVYKSQSLAELWEVITAVMAGETRFPEPRTIPLPQGETPLTPREMEILRLICKRMTNKEIADALFISERTVKFHRENMLAKTGFERIVDLAFYMITNGWINPLY